MIAERFILSATPEEGLGAVRLIAGVDEAGRGPLAGPVVAAVVVLCQAPPDGLGDSKKLSAAKRAALEQAVRTRCAWAIGVVEPEIIDRVNIFNATMLAMTQAVDRLDLLLGERGIGVPDEVLVDGKQTPDGRVREWRWPARAIVGGDATEPAISAASIIAKEYRDRLMRQAAHDYPHYGWDRNKGYGTAEHLRALREHGPTLLHRRSFAPVAQSELIV